MRLLDLSSKPRVKGARHWSAEVNQLYHPTGIFKQDSWDIVYSQDNINTTKFIPILLKEWFYLVKKSGYLVVDYKPNKICSFQKLEKDMWWLWKGKYDISYHGPLRDSELRSLDTRRVTDFIKNVPNQPVMPKGANGPLRFVCKKLEQTRIPGDNINRWTFGIVTKGERNEWVEEIIQSIHKQKIPHYEIIVCGTYFNREEKNFTYIPFKERDDRGWITKKKNLMARIAKYENLCLLHDRIVLDKNWFSGVKKYGNCFEFLCNKQILKGEGIKAGDWLTYGSSVLDVPYSISRLDYQDWDEYVYMGGQLSILKRFIWQRCPWNEARYWGEEDVELSFRARDFGFLIRFNEHSSCTALAWRFGDLPSKYYPSQSIIPKDFLVRRLLRLANKILFSIPAGKKLLSPGVTALMKSRVYRFLIGH